MRFSNSNGDFFELVIAGYQFPTITDDQWDSNWLNMAGKASLNGRAWKFLEPCLLTWEISELAEWLMMKSTEEKTKVNVSFVEPDCPKSAQ